MRPLPVVVPLAGAVSAAAVLLLGVAFAETCAFPYVCEPVDARAAAAWTFAPLALHASAIGVAGYAWARHGRSALGGVAILVAVLAADATLNFGGRVRQYEAPAAGLSLGLLAVALALGTLADRERLGRLRAPLLAVGIGGLLLGFRFALMAEVTSIPLVSRYPVLRAGGFGAFAVGLAALVAAAWRAELLAARNAAPRDLPAAAAGIAATFAVAGGWFATLAANRFRWETACSGAPGCGAAGIDPSFELALGYAFVAFLLLAAAVTFVAYPPRASKAAGPGLAASEKAT